jgi:hypothetical protein
MELKILSDRYGYQQAVDELKEQWLYELLLHIGVEEEVLEEWDSSLFLGRCYPYV